MSLEREVGMGRGQSTMKKTGRWRYVIGLFLLLLLVSHIVRWTNRSTINLRPDQTSMPLRVVDDGKLQDSTITAAYTWIAADTTTYTTPATLVLLHGSPMASMSMLALAEALPDSFNILVPDLPGLGRSTRNIPDYSVAAHAIYLDQMLEALEIKQAHFIAYSMSGGVAIESYARTPEKIKSVVMLSAIGVQELELLGSYEMNRAVHGLQLAFLWGIQELTPHMGYLDDALLNTSYARNFYDTDQRPLREILEQYEGPMLILHGKEDMQVPLEAAQEHERIVPQSTLVAFEGGHGLVFQPSTAFVDTLTSLSTLQIRARHSPKAPLQIRV